jgi:hypothetical protein
MVSSLWIDYFTIYFIEKWEKAEWICDVWKNIPRKYVIYLFDEEGKYDCTIHKTQCTQLRSQGVAIAQ